MWGQDRPILWALAASAALHGAAAALAAAWPWQFSPGRLQMVQITWLPSPGHDPSPPATPASLSGAAAVAAPTRSAAKVTAAAVAGAGAERHLRAKKRALLVSRSVPPALAARERTRPGAGGEVGKPRPRDPQPLVRASAQAASAPAGERTRGQTAAAPPAGPLVLSSGRDLRSLCLSCPAPRYPLKARREGWQGEVDVAVEIGRDGRVKRARLQRSCGHLPLDRAALDVARRSRFFAGTDRGVRAGSIRYLFILNGQP